MAPSRFKAEEKYNVIQPCKEGRSSITFMGPVFSCKCTSYSNFTFFKVAYIRVCCVDLWRKEKTFYVRGVIP
ncbi:hypothetical protein D7Z54_15490 [Salibacterium salarium]|uniref:Uncharacterized protein n=1 Tax=Salibacterium salarium TaxID=284579 RepID=A0A3R9QSQ7_9BACI|nr:hypothetical protein D7Z54_15490 [Salibacterium salarium]